MPSMISLIISADDLGSNAERDRGILEAFNQGVVTSASLLANGASFAAAVAQVKTAKVPIGVHLNLADGLTLTGPIKGLTDACGRLPGKQKLRHYLLSSVCDLAALRNELTAQIEKVLNAGLFPDHLDSHQHCQIFPSLTPTVIELAQAHNISALRTSLPAEHATQDPDGLLGAELALYRRLSQEAHMAILNAGITAPDGLWGMPFLNRLDTVSLCQLLENLPEGRWELMTHPGYPWDLGGPFDGRQRQLELNALVSDEVKEIILRRRINLCSFGELSCAS